MRCFPLSIDVTCAALASTQHGLLTRYQAMELGMSPASINRRVRAGTFILMFPHVYRLAAAPRSWHQRAMATAMWAGSNSLIAGYAAAGLHRLDGFALPNRIEVWTPRSLKSPHPLVILRRTELVEAGDRSIVGGISVMSPLRTLIDVAGLVSEERLEIALEDIMRRRLAALSTIADRVGRMPPNRRGQRDLKSVLARRGAAPPAESGLEVRVIRLLRANGYPNPVRQRVLDDDGHFVGRVDLVYHDRRLILEVDGFRYHSGREAWEGDRRRRNALSALGWMVMHVTHRMISDEPERFLRDLGRSYARTL